MRSINHFYCSHGLIIKSPIQLSGFNIEKTDTPDVIISYGNLTQLSGTVRRVWLNEDVIAVICRDVVNLSWRSIEICTIKFGNKILINPSTGFEENFLRLILLGFAIPILLHQRGILSLHANAVNMNGRAIGLLGPMGIGKSTTSLLLDKMGYKIISDDILRVNDNDTIISVFSGSSMMKIWPDVIRSINEDPETYPQISSYTKKRFYHINNFYQGTYPLHAIYSIKEANNTFIEEMSPHQSVMELVKATNWAIMFDKGELYNNLKRCTLIAQKVPIKLLNIERSLDKLSKVVEVIEKDLFDN